MQALKEGVEKRQPNAQHFDFSDQVINITLKARLVQYLYVINNNL